MKKIHITENPAGIDHELRWDGGREIYWVAPDGAKRIPEEVKKTYAYPGLFMAAGKPYAGLRGLLAQKDETGYLGKDIYGREVFYISELFPCFDSYDYANENRYYRWFFIKENGKLIRIYHADERNTVEVTEDVRYLENKCREVMEEMGWLKEA